VSELVSFELENGGTVLVEISSSGSGISRANRAGDTVRSAASTFESALSHVRDAATSALQLFKEIPQPPDQITIEFGVTLNAQFGAVIAEAGATGNLKVALNWNRASRDEERAGDAQHIG
jgi:hypothetical protein